MAKHTMSMYPTKDAMIESMQADIDSLETENTDIFDRFNDEITDLRAQLAEEQYVTKRLSETLAKISILVGYIPERNDPAQIDKVVEKLRAQLAEVRKDSERLDYFEHRYLRYTSYYKNERQEHEIEDGYGDIFTGYNIRESIDNAMKGGE